MLKRNRDGKNQMNIKESNHATEKQASNSTEVPSSSARLGALCCMIGANMRGGTVFILPDRCGVGDGA